MEISEKARTKNVLFSGAKEYFVRKSAKHHCQEGSNIVVVRSTVKNTFRARNARQNMRQDLDYIKKTRPCRIESKI